MRIWLWLGLAVAQAVTLAVAVAAFEEHPPLSCQQQLRARYAQEPRQWLSVRGVTRPFRVWETADAAQRALAHLLLLLLRHALGYGDQVQLHRVENPTPLLNLSSIAKLFSPDEYVAVPGLRVCAADKAQSEALALLNHTDSYIFVAETGPAPQLVLQAALSARAARQPACSDALSWRRGRLANRTLLEACDFPVNTTDFRAVPGLWPTPSPPCSADGPGCAPVLVAGDRVDAAADLLLHAQAGGLPLMPVPLSHPNGRIPEAEARASRSSSLFLAYTMRGGGVEASPPPDVPCTSLLAPAPAYMLVHKHLRFTAHRAFFAIINFMRGANAATAVSVAAEASGAGAGAGGTGRFEEAACEWLLRNPAAVARWVPEPERAIDIQYCLCQGDPHLEQYRIAMKRVEGVLQREAQHYEPRLRLVELPCASGEARLLDDHLRALVRGRNWARTGAVLASGAGAALAANATRAFETLVVLYDARGAVGAVEQAPVLRSAAHWGQLGVATGAWLATQRRMRAILVAEQRSSADVTELAARLGASGVRLLTVPNATGAAQCGLPWRRQQDAARCSAILIERAVATGSALLVDAGSAAVEGLLCAAAGRSAPQSPLLLLRVWSPRPLQCPTAQFERLEWWTVTGGWVGAASEADAADAEAALGAQDAPLRRQLRAHLGNISGEVRPWPPHLAELVDAALTAARSLDLLLAHHPERRHDLHGDEVTTRALSALIRRNWTEGVTQRLEYDASGSLRRARVFVSRWSGRRATLEAVLNVNSSVCEWAWRRSQARATAVLLGAALALLLLLSLLVFGARRMRSATADPPVTLPDDSTLAHFELGHDQLEVREQLGEGSSGRVFSALLSVAGAGGRRIVAVKVPLNQKAGGDELLSEARLLASLDHEHVVRLLGVVSQKAPPLLVLEYACFGDLEQYLAHAARRAGGVALVPPELLTRLAYEAACALAYLARRGVVHRDVRAANCLVDARQSLKLSDFGMARAVAAGGAVAASEGGYVCRRRALFPVRWMAPESLGRGVSTAASDVWSYGVLLLELATLGALPYGAWPSRTVLCYVLAGGAPQLPCDASPDMHALTQQCWYRSAALRIRAARIVAFLEQRPRALTPCGLAAARSLPPPPPPPPSTSHKAQNSRRGYKSQSLAPMT